MKNLLLFILLFYSCFTFAQQDAWVFLTDKQNVETSINNPITILTQQAIDRKNAHGVVIDERDVPVNEAYISQLKQQTGITVMAKSKWMNAIHVRGTETDISALTNLSFVATIEFADKSINTGRFSGHNNKFEIEESLVDFNYGDTQNQIEMINANTLHINDFTGEGLIIAVLDTGFPNVNTMNAFQRIRDNGDLLDGYDFVDRTDNIYAYTANNHGTKVLSTMAGYVEGSYVGSAPDASYYLFRTEDAASENPVEESYWVEAAERADSLGVDIINTSLGYKTYDNPNYSYTNSDLNGETAFITRGANIAFEKGMLIVVSAGNSGVNGVGAPADSPNVLSIGSVDENGIYSSFSSQGSAIQPTQKPDVVARGGLAFVIGDNDIIVNNNGTSFSAPIISGGLACLWQALPTASNLNIMQYVRMSASQYTTPDYFLGYGIPDLELAYTIGLSLQEIEIVSIKIYPNPVNEELHINFPNTNEVFQLNIYDVLGNLVYNTILNNSFNTIKTSFLSSGMYVLTFETNGILKTFKLLKS